MVVFDRFQFNAITGPQAEAIVALVDEHCDDVGGFSRAIAEPSAIGVTVAPSGEAGVKTFEGTESPDTPEPVSLCVEYSDGGYNSFILSGWYIPGRGDEEEDRMQQLRDSTPNKK